MSGFLATTHLPCGTSAPAISSRKSASGRQFVVRTFAAQDAFCKDKVATPKTSVAVEGTATVSFLGAGGHEIRIECPKVDGDALDLAS